MKRKQNWIWVLIVLLLITIVLMSLPRKAGASGGGPIVTVYDLDNGYTIRVNNPDGSTCDIGRLDGDETFFIECWKEGDDHAVPAVVKEVGASDGYPKGVQVFQVDSHTCVLYVGSGKAGLECFCPCEEDCNVVTYTDEPKPTDKPGPKPTDKPDPTPDPVKNICHVPPGNPKNAHTIGCKTSGCIAAHLAHHDDYLGKCK